VIAVLLIGLGNYAIAQDNDTSTDGSDLTGNPGILWHHSRRQVRTADPPMPARPHRRAGARRG